MNVEVPISKNILWTKKIGETHIMGKNSTLCGTPMLGNNYPPDAENMCETCRKEYLKEKEIKINLKFKLV